MTPEYEYVDALVGGVPAKGRGAGLNPGNRYEPVRLHVLGEHLDTQCGDDQQPAAATQVIADQTRSVINRVASDDLPFKWTINPYRGCEHGCVYCYARPDHERLGYSSGLDFETKIIAKHNAPRLLARELAKPKWRGEAIVMSGVTDPYQPIEKQLRITRGCLEAMAAAHQPVTLITKNRLILRDIDLLTALAEHHAVHVAVSVTTLDNDLAAKMEPRASAPADRLKLISALAARGIPVMAMIAPVLPGLTDREVPQLLKAVADAGAMSASYVLLRLPYAVKALYLDWLARQYPDRAKRAEALLRQMRGGALYDSTYRKRRGEGPIAEQIRTVFEVFARRYGLDRPLAPLSSAHFHAPSPDGQMGLFT